MTQQRPAQTTTDSDRLLHAARGSTYVTIGGVVLASGGSTLAGAGLLLFGAAGLTLCLVKGIKGERAAANRPSAATGPSMAAPENAPL